MGGREIPVVDLFKPFQPCAIHYPVSDRFEILTREGPTVTRHVPGSDVYWLLDMDTREIIGMGVEFARTYIEHTSTKDSP